MANLDKLDLDDPAPILEDEDDENLAAIDEGIRDATAGRTISIGEVTLIHTGGRATKENG